MTSYLVIVNPASGRGRARLRADVLCSRLPKSCHVEVVETGHRGAAAELAASRAASVDRIIAVGGDGTLNEVLSGLMATGRSAQELPELGFLPAGTANAATRAFGFNSDPDVVASELREADSRPVDVGVVSHEGGERPFLLWFGGGTIGATFTFVFTSGGVPTDVDNDGRLDTAFREIYYDTSFNWADDGATNVDVETVAAHEIGHGLSQAHFGKVFIKGNNGRRNGSIQFSPKAVLNAVYVGPQRSLLGTDNGGHCSNWAQWPNS